MSPFDSDSANDEQSTPAQHFQKLITDNLICAITLELPFDPVTAEDGRVYERSAIEKHIKSKPTAELKSPVTNENMGGKLLSAVMQKNQIESMIENKVITGELASGWEAKAKEKKDWEMLLQRAESGDSEAMFLVGRHFFTGNPPVNLDQRPATKWFRRAHEAGNVDGTAFYGICLAEGYGVAKCYSQGVLYIGMAASQGSHQAACHLGCALADGFYGLPINLREAIQWLEKSLSADSTVYGSMGEKGKQVIREKILQLQRECAT